MKTLSGIALLIILVVATNLQAVDYTESSEYLGRRTSASFCGKLKVGTQYGPFDYTNAYERNTYLPIVESEHFTSDVQNLIKGHSGSIGGELGYTLRTFPNHYPALIAFTKLVLRDKTAVRPDDEIYTIECYFDRAMRFRPGDANVHMIYANYLGHLGGRQNDAIEQYQEALRLQPENATVNYNLGLMYVKEKDYEQAITYAKKAYGLGFPLPGLRNKLMKTGKWDGKLDEEVRDEAEGNVDEKIDVEPQK
jgi:tetratricopeptide (TPR) repeat protein